VDPVLAGVDLEEVALADRLDAAGGPHPGAGGTALLEQQGDDLAPGPSQNNWSAAFLSRSRMPCRSTRASKP